MEKKPSRRAVLAAISGSAALCAFDLATRRWLTSAAHAQGTAQLVPSLSGELVTDWSERVAMGEDFGHLRRGVPLAVLRPGSYYDVVSMVRFARRFRIPIAMRGNGHSNFGQANAEAGIAIDSRTLSRIHTVKATYATVDAGVLWRDLIAASASHQSAPAVLTDYLDLSVGGTLSMGGIGGASSRFGLQLDQVMQLKVVTGAGDLLECSPQLRPELFHAVLGGSGQCGIIVRATVRLVERLPQAFQANLYYDALAPFQLDQERLLAEQRFDYLEGQVVFPAEGGSPRFMIEVAKYHPADLPPDSDALLDGLADDRASAQLNSLPYEAWAARLDPQVAFLKELGLWETPHPWLNLFIPSSQLQAFMTPLLNRLTPADLGGGVILLYPVASALITAPLFRLPAEPIAWSLSMLRFTADEASATAMVADNRALYESNVALGGTRYAIGAIPMSQDDWRAHYGSQYPRFARAKAQFDPEGILTPGPGIF